MRFAWGHATRLSIVRLTIQERALQICCAKRRNPTLLTFDPM